MSQTFNCGSFDLKLPGPLFLIEANAGTGKTYNIQKLFRRFLEETELSISQILVVTFTDAATAELRDRIRSELGEAIAAAERNPPATNTRAAQSLDRLRLAAASFDEAAISTIHGFCQRSLRQFAFESGAPFECELTQDDSTYREEAVQDFYAAYLERHGGTCGVSLQALKDFAAALLTEPAPALKIDPAAWAENGLQEKSRALLAAVRDAAFPKRDSGFRRALEAIQPKLQAPDLLDQILAATDLWKSSVKESQPIGTAKREYDEALAFEVMRPFVAYLTDAKTGVAARRDRAAVLSFNDLLTRMRDALGDDPQSPLAKMLRKTYRVVLVDEFQDTDPTQYAIFKTAFNQPGWKLFMIGDPKQAIYAFRGGDFATYLRARQEVPEGNRYTLVNNFRATAPMIESVNRLFGVQAAPPFLDKNIPYEPSRCGEKDKGELLQDNRPLTQPFKLIWLNGDENQVPIAKGNCADACLVEAAETLVRMLNDPAYTLRPPAAEAAEPRRLRPSDFAILVDTNGECQTLHQLLIARNVPAVIYKSGNVFASTDAKDLAFILDAILNTSQSRVFRSALLTPWCGQTFSDIAKADETPELVARREQVREIAPLWRRTGVAVAVAKFMDIFHGYENLAKRGACERHLVNERQLVEILNQQERAASLQPEGVLKFLRHCIADSGNPNEAYEERLENDSRAVTIMTIHKSKGLQFPIVICPTLALAEHNLRPGALYRTHDAAGHLILPYGSKEYGNNLARGTWESFAEKIRLVYVAVTRPVYACIVIAGAIKHGNGKSANFQNAFNYLAAIRHQPLPLADETVPAIPCPTPDFGDWMDVTKKSYSEFGSGQTRYRPAETVEPKEKQLPALPRIPESLAVMSYSAMVQHGNALSALPPSGGTDEAAASAAGAAPDPLPRSNTSGLAVHETFEHIDYRAAPETWLHSAEIALRRNGLDAGQNPARRDRVIELVRATLGTTLPGLGFKLNQVPFPDTRREWKFYFSVPRPVNLAPFEAAGLTFAEKAGTRQGFMNGSIDLLFRKDGRYYFADWKTDTLEDYSASALKGEMVSRNYLFQAIVYSLALYDLLKLTLPDFNYEKHIGGGFYCFVRDIAEDRGIYRFTLTEKELLGYRACFQEASK